MGEIILILTSSPLLPHGPSLFLKSFPVTSDAVHIMPLLGKQEVALHPYSLLSFGGPPSPPAV